MGASVMYVWSVLACLLLVVNKAKTLALVNKETDQYQDAVDTQPQINFIPQAIRARLLGPGPLPGSLRAPQQQQQQQDFLQSDPAFKHKDNYLADLQKLRNQFGFLLNPAVHRLSQRSFSRANRALPPWSEFCRLLDMAYCKRFRRSAGRNTARLTESS